MIDDQGRRGVVTGTSSGSGELFAQRLAGRGTVARPGQAQPEPDRRSRGPHPDATGVGAAPRRAGSMTISRPAEVQAGCGAGKGAERD
jgi:NAD(P)-dependent dehydrogenase (short-subunit alcohol dehydrogenase family)